MFRWYKYHKIRTENEPREQQHEQEEEKVNTKTSVPTKNKIRTKTETPPKTIHEIKRPIVTVLIENQAQTMPTMIEEEPNSPIIDNTTTTGD